MIEILMQHKVTKNVGTYKEQPEEKTKKERRNVKEKKKQNLKWK
jgi:hypothetical protein